jgi:hypothetical protein
VAAERCHSTGRFLKRARPRALLLHFKGAELRWFAMTQPSTSALELFASVPTHVTDGGIRDQSLVDGEANRGVLTLEAAPAQSVRERPYWARNQEPVIGSLQHARDYHTVNADAELPPVRLPRRDLVADIDAGISQAGYQLCGDQATWWRSLVMR